jgi:GNAT superfamily N-acetyltransferase
MKLSTFVMPDAITEEIGRAFDYAFDGHSRTEVADLPPLPTGYGIGLIVGPSGSGKSTMLRTLGTPAEVVWHEGKAVASHFRDATDARNRLAATGLNSIPAWCRPFHVLSTGEQFRADLARRLEDGACIDEFTSVVDRNVAKSCSAAIARYVRENGLRGVVLATCHYDVIPWLDPDWTFDTATGVLTPRGSVQRPQIKLDLLPCAAEAWAMFRQHHYLSETINRAARCWIAVWDGTPVGFASALAFPSAHIRNAWREHRTVCLPDFQGIGLGVRISDAVAELFHREGIRYFSKTAHPRMGEYREASPLWRGTSKNRKKRADYNHNRVTKEDAYRHRHADRWTYSHEYIGAADEATGAL